MDCPQYQDHITRHIDRPLSPEIEAHVKGCPACAKFFENERRVDMVARDAFATLKLDRDLTDKILRRLPEAEEMDDLPTPGARILWWSAGLAAAAAMLIVGLMFSSSKTKPPASPNSTASRSGSTAPNEVIVEKNGIMVTFRSNKQEYTAHEIITISSTFKIPKDLRVESDGVMTFRITNGRDEEIKTTTVDTPDHQKPGGNSWFYSFAVITPDIYKCYLHQQIRTQNNIFDFPMTITFTVRNTSDKPELSTPVTGSTELRYRLKTNEGDNVREMAERTREVFLRRVDLMGLPTPEILVEKDGTIVVRIPDATSPATYKDILGRVGHLQLTEVGDAELHKAHAHPAAPNGWVWIDNIEGNAGGEYSHLNAKKILVREKSIIDGTHIETARSDRSGFGDHIVSFTLTPAGARIFEEATERLAGKGQIAIIFDGKLQSRPFVKSKISRHGQIDGYDSEESAKQIAAVLRSGALPAPVELISERITGVPDLSTPEKAWAALLEALTSGDEERIKAVTTEKVRESLKVWQGKANECTTIERWAINGETARATAWREPKVPGGFVTIELKKTPEGWKLDNLARGK